MIVLVSSLTWLAVVIVLIGCLYAAYLDVREVLQVMAAARAGTLQLRRGEPESRLKEITTATFWIVGLVGYLLGLVNGYFTGTLLPPVVITTSALALFGFSMLTVWIINRQYRAQGLDC